LKKHEDIGNIVVGDWIYLDAGTFFNHDFKNKPNYFVYPTSHKASFEMYSVAKTNIASIPQNCEGPIVVFHHGIIYDCDNKLKFYSYKEDLVLNEMKIESGTRCGGSYLSSDHKTVFTFCRRMIDLKSSKLYVVQIGLTKKRRGNMKIVGRSFVTAAGGHRFRVIKSITSNLKSFILFWSEPELKNLGKVTRYGNMQIFKFSEATKRIEELTFDFTGLEEPMVNLQKISLHKLENDSHSLYLIVLRGYMKSQTYKFNRFQSIFECIWDTDTLIINSCREILFENQIERLPGLLLNVTTTEKVIYRRGPEMRRIMNFDYNEPTVMGGTIMRKSISYPIQGNYTEFERAAINFEGTEPYKKMAPCQYYPIYTSADKIFYIDEFTKTVKLISWFDNKTKRTSLRYVDAEDFLEEIDSNDLCTYRREKVYCYDWSGDAFLKSDTTLISPAFKNFFFFLNHNERINNPYPKTLEIKAKIDEPIAIRSQRMNLQKNISVIIESNVISKIANVRSIMKDTPMEAVKSLTLGNNEIMLEREKEMRFFYVDRGVEKEIVAEKTSFNFGKILIECLDSICFIYNNCQEYDSVASMDVVCQSKLEIEELNSKNINKVYYYLNYLIVLTNEESPFVMIYNLLLEEKYIVLRDQISRDRRKVTVSFSGFDILISTVITSGHFEIYQVALDKKVQTLLKQFKPFARCTSDIASTYSNNFMVTIYSKCKNHPPKIISYRSSNLQTFTKQIFAPKASILGREKIRGLCMFEQGVVFVTKNAIFYFNRKNKFFIKSNPLKLTKQNYKVKCLRGDLLGFYTRLQMTVFNFKNFYTVRYKHAVKYDIENIDAVVPSFDGNFYVKAGTMTEKVRFYKLLWTNFDVYAKAFESVNQTIQIKVGFESSYKLLDVDFTVVRPGSVKSTVSSKHGYFDFTQKHALSNDSNLINLKENIIGGSCYWSIYVTHKKSGAISRIMPETVNLKKYMSKTPIFDFDAYERRIYFVKPDSLRGTAIGFLEFVDEQDTHPKEHIMMKMPGLCNQIKVVKYYEDFVVFVYCKEIGSSQLNMIRYVEGEYVNSYESVKSNFDIIEVHAIAVNTFVITFYDSLVGELNFRLFAFEKINNFKYLRFKELRSIPSGKLQIIP